MIEVKVNGKGAIEIDGLNARPGVFDADEVTRQLSDALGEKWGAVKLGGIWIIGRTENGWNPIFGHMPGQQTRKFVTALANATGRAVVQSVPLKK